LHLSQACLHQTLYPGIDGENVDDEFGTFVALSDDGSIVAVVATDNSNDNGGYGHVRVYQWITDAWMQLGSDIDGFGVRYEVRRMSLSGNGSILAIGEPANNVPGRHAQVRVFNWSGTSWNQMGNTIDDLDRRYGIPLTLSNDGSILAIGTYSSDENIGLVRVLQWNGADWSQLGEAIDGEPDTDIFDRSVSLSGDGTIVAIGARHARVFQWSAGTIWTQLGGVIDREGESDYVNRLSPVSLSKDGSVLAMGAYTMNSYVGFVRVFDWNGVSWNQRGNDIVGEAQGDASGRSLSLSSDGDIVAIGAPGNNGVNGGNSGHVRVYQWIASAWVQVGVDIDGETEGDESGSSVSLSGDGSIVAIGAPFNLGHFGVTNGYTGQVRVYSCN